MGRHARKAALGVVGLVIVMAGLWFASSMHGAGAAGSPWTGSGTLVGVSLVIAAVLACFVGVMLLPGQTGAVEASSIDRGTLDAHPYRPSPIVHQPPARVSARFTALLILACMGFTTLVVPFALHLPRWLEVEGVLGGWWVAWAAVLSVLAYRGRPLDDAGETLWLDEGAKPAAPRTESPRRWSPWWMLADLPASEALLPIVLFVLAISAALVAAWLVVELVAPALFFAAYFGLRRALSYARASDDRGDLRRSAIHGVAWATTYIAPLAAVVAMVHAIAR